MCNPSPRIVCYVSRRIEPASPPLRSHRLFENALQRTSLVPRHPRRTYASTLTDSGQTPGIFRISFRRLTRTSLHFGRSYCSLLQYLRDIYHQIRETRRGCNRPFDFEITNVIIGDSCERVLGNSDSDKLRLYNGTIRNLRIPCYFKEGFPYLVFSLERSVSERLKHPDVENSTLPLKNVRFGTFGKCSPINVYFVLTDL